MQWLWMLQGIWNIYNLIPPHLSISNLYTSFFLSHLNIFSFFVEQVPSLGTGNVTAPTVTVNRTVYTVNNITKIKRHRQTLLFLPIYTRLLTRPVRCIINRVRVRQQGWSRLPHTDTQPSLKQHVFVLLLHQHVGGLCDGAQRRQPCRNLLLRPLTELLLLLLDLLQPGGGYERMVRHHGINRYFVCFLSILKLNRHY